MTRRVLRISEEDKRATTNVQNRFVQFFFYLFFSFVLLELKPLVLKGKVLGEKLWKSAKKCKKCENYETILPFSCCPLVFLWVLSRVRSIVKGTDCQSWNCPQTLCKAVKLLLESRADVNAYLEKEPWLEVVMWMPMLNTAIPLTSYRAPARIHQNLSAPKSQRFLRFAIAMPIADPRNRAISETRESSVALRFKGAMESR